jgi:hypothetical protein
MILPTYTDPMEIDDQRTPGHHRLHFEAARIELGSSADRFLDYSPTIAGAAVTLTSLVMIRPSSQTKATPPSSSVASGSW